jgi:hypothetical protein
MFPRHPAFHFVFESLLKTRWKRLAYLCVFAAVVTICSEQPSCATPNLALPATAAQWTLRSPQDWKHSVPSELQIWPGTRQARQVCRAEYGGSPPMRLTIYYMPGWSGATAFDALQKWQRQPGKMAFYKGHYFGVVESGDSDRNALNRFTAAVESSLPAGAEFRW